jgi:DNA polymerase (family 10)
MRQRALARNLSMSEWGITSTVADTPSPPAATNEAALFQVLGLPWIPPELREGAGEIEAAEAGQLPQLVEESDIRGSFHNHTTASDGRATLEEMAAAAEALGWEYLGIADHSKSSLQARGLDEARLARQVEEIHRINASGRFRCRLLSGTECDILPDGELDFPDDLLGSLDYYVVSVHSAFSQTESEMTERIVRALQHPGAIMVGHLTGRLLLSREPYRVDIGKVIEAAADRGAVIELNANPRRLDMDWRWWRRAVTRGVKTSVNPDAHNAEDLKFVRAGVQTARKGWLRSIDVINTLSLADVTRWLADCKSRR